MKFILIPALCLLSSCANNGILSKRNEQYPDPVKISEMFTGEWVCVKLNKNPGLLNRFLYSRGTIGENRKTVVMTQISAGFDIVKFQCYYERNGIQFGKSIKYLYFNELQEVAKKALDKNQNVIILTAGGIPEINKLITRKFKTNNASGIVMNHMSAFKLRRRKL